MKGRKRNRQTAKKEAHSNKQGSNDRLASWQRAVMPCIAFDRLAVSIDIEGERLMNFVTNFNLIGK
jgi:hypothetical protein